MKENTNEEVETARVYRRFYAALQVCPSCSSSTTSLKSMNINPLTPVPSQLRDLCNEMPIDAVARKYDIPRGNIQSLSQACHGFAAGMIKFCQRMKWGSLAAVLDHFSDRLKAGRSILIHVSEYSNASQEHKPTSWLLPRSCSSRAA